MLMALDTKCRISVGDFVEVKSLETIEFIKIKIISFFCPKTPREGRRILVQDAEPSDACKFLLALDERLAVLFSFLQENVHIILYCR